MFCITVCFGLYFEPMGLAAARMDVRAFNVVMMPAFAIETVCCSLTHCCISPMRRDKQAGNTYHDFVQNATCCVRHLVELIDTTYTSVAQYKRTTRIMRELLAAFSASRTKNTDLSSTSCFESGSRVT